MKEENNRIYTVYKHTSPSNKIYIGITHLNPERRWRANGSGYKGNQYFYNAIKKYGWENFKHEILFSGLTKEEAEQKEIELIACYDSTNHNKGYNISYGGNSIGKHSEESKRKMSESKRGKYIGGNNYFYGKHHPEEVKYILSQKAKERFANKENHPFYGRSHSEDTKKKLSEINTGKHITEETKRKISIANTGDKNSMYGKTHTEEVKGLLSQLRKKPVWQYSLDGKFLKEWDSALDAELATGMSRVDISACCSGKIRTSSGYIWRYKGDLLNLDDLEWIVSGNNKSVSQYAKDGEFIKKYNSIKDASIETGIDNSAIASCCKGKKKTAGKYIWRYANEELTEEHLNWCNGFDINNKLLKAVSQYTYDGIFLKTFNSMSEASRETGISVSSISSCCKEKTKSAGGFVWKYTNEINDVNNVC